MVEAVVAIARDGPAVAHQVQLVREVQQLRGLQFREVVNARGQAGQGLAQLDRVELELEASEASLGGNHFTPARFLVPMGIKDPAERIVEIGRLTRLIRDEPAVALTDAM